MAKKAVIAGTSGLIGSKLLSILLEDPEYSEILILVRRKTRYNFTKLKSIILDFDDLENYAQLINGHALFCCLGSTRKRTPEKADFRKVDHDYPLKLAEIALRNGMNQYHLVSAIGADAHSKNFYTQMKGETEDDIKALGIPSVFIYQPSVLIGSRTERRFWERILKKIMKIIDPLLIGKYKKYRSIRASIVSRAMFNQSLTKKTGIFVYPSDQITQLS